MVATLDRFADHLRHRNPKGLRWEYHRFFDEDHASIPNKVIDHGLRFAFSEWNTIPDEVAAAGVPAIRAYVAGLEQRYGDDIGVAWTALRRVARSYQRAQRSKDGVEVLRLAVEYNPTAEMAWRDLGRAYATDGRPQEAVNALRTAHRLAVENVSPHVSIFVDALAELEKKLPRP